jgi:hypothetical protein
MSGGWWCAHAEHGARGQREESGRSLVHSRIGEIVQGMKQMAGDGVSCATSACAPAGDRNAGPANRSPGAVTCAKLGRFVQGWVPAAQSALYGD